MIHEVQDGFDPDFYRMRNADLADLSDDELREHFNAFGRHESRIGNWRAFFEYLAFEGHPIPADFNPAIYRSLNADVDAASPTDIQCYEHYALYGANEGRPYREAALNGRPQRSLREAVDRPLDKPARSQVALEDLLRANRVDRGDWLSAFSLREFLLLNFGWVPATSTWEDAVRLFVEQGITRLAPISFAARFDVNFYRELHPELARYSDAFVYRRWLGQYAAQAQHSSVQAWLSGMGLKGAEYPAAFAWRRYAAVHLPALDVDRSDARWRSLAHLVEHVGAVDVPVINGGGEFLTDIATTLALRGQGAEAAALLERAVQVGGPAEARMYLADSYSDRKQWRSASAVYTDYHAMGSSTVWSVARSSRADCELGQYDRAIATLVKHKPRYAGEQPWRDAVNHVLQGYYEQCSTSSRAMLAQGLRAEADVLITAMTARIACWLEQVDDVAPATRLPRRPRIVMLAVTSLRQCKHYRVDQKVEYARLQGLECEVFDIGETVAFLAALPGASAAIIYRAPAFPQVIRAILAARAQRIPTFYDIDDLIFDSALYPDPLASFEGAISIDEYEALCFGTPLHRAAMAICDYGMASTPALAEHVRSVVRTGDVFVQRNGMDSRLLQASAQTRQRSNGSRVRIFYGSATLAHNKDFNDIAVVALLPLMRKNPDLSLVIVGHLDLHPDFDDVADQVVKIELIADPAAYWELLSNCDINVATLTDTPMNNCKSEIKWLEAAALGVPSIVSSTATYRAAVENGRTGVLAASNEEWVEAVNRLVASADERHRIAEQAREAVNTYYSPAVLARNLEVELARRAAPDGTSGKKRLLVVNVFYPPQAIGGATRIVAEQVVSLAAEHAEDWEVAVAATDYGNREAHQQSFDVVDGVPVFRIAPPFAGDADWRPEDDGMKNWFKRVMAAFQPDLVHFHCVQRLTASVLQACVEEDTPYVVSIHDGWWLSDYQFLFDENCHLREPGDLEHGIRPGVTLSDSLKRSVILQAALHGAAALTAPSDTFSRLYAGAGFPEITTVANGSPKLDVLPRVPSASGRVRIGHIGDTSPHKGFDLVEAALRDGDFANLELLAISYARGDGFEARELWGATPVTLRGRVSQDRVAELYAELDVLLAPSACVESFGLVTREANAAGVWVVASDRGGIAEDVREGTDGFRVDVSSPADLFRILALINDDPARFRQPAPIRPVRTTVDQTADFVALYQRVLDTSSVEQAGSRLSRSPSNARGNRMASLRHALV